MKAAGGVERIHGYRAGLAVLTTRPADVIRIACVRSILDEVEEALGPAHAKAIGGVGVLDDRGIEKLAHTNQHEGICLEAKERRWLSSSDLGAVLGGGPKKGTAIALDRVRNSYNIGAILRSAAFFGVDAVLLGAPAPHPGLDPNAIRVAEGGAERVLMSRTTDLADTLSRVKKAGVRVVGTDGESNQSVLDCTFEHPTVVIMGNEREGLSPRIRSQCDELVAIKGSGNIESLNVGVAAGIVIASMMRSRH